MKKKLILAYVLAASSIIAVLFFWQQNALLTLLLLAICAATLVTIGKKDFPVFFLTSLFGALSEILAIRFGVWTYANPTYLGIPLWLPLLWGQASLFICAAYIDQVK